ncbi:MAG: hypothetical protein R3F11_08105 [Verrucomicrobiales bacterium]
MSQGVDICSTDSGKNWAVVEKFANKGDDGRLRDIMLLGDTGHLGACPILEYAIAHDSDIGVRFAALKRIANF